MNDGRIKKLHRSWREKYSETEKVIRRFYEKFYEKFLEIVVRDPFSPMNCYQMIGG